jgi:hypothetical protein
MRRGGGACGGAVLHRPVRPCTGVAVSTCQFSEARSRACVRRVAVRRGGPACMRAVVRGRGAVVGMRTGGRAYCGYCVVKHTTNRSLSGKGGVGARGLCVVKQTHDRLTGVQAMYGARHANAPAQRSSQQSPWCV